MERYGDVPDPPKFVLELDLRFLEGEIMERIIRGAIRVLACCLESTK
jgi:hypothetical protein